MPDFIPNPYWTALATEQSSIALGGDLARCFAADVIPFAGVREPIADAMDSLYGLLAPGEMTYVTGAALPAHAGLASPRSFPGWQMHFAGSMTLLPPEQESGNAPRIEVLTEHNAAEMVTLTDVAFPGYFRLRTWTLGRYFGIRAPGGQLIAMGGERLALPGLREISAVCTHPAHTGRGYAARLIGALIRLHTDAGLKSFLHVTGSNHRAIRLYERLGFVTTGEIVWNRIERLQP